MRFKAAITKSRLCAIYVLMDILTTSLAWLGYTILRNWSTAHDISLAEYYTWTKTWVEQVCFPFIMLAIFWLSGYYNDVENRSRVQEFLMTISSCCVGAIIIFFLAVVNDELPRRRLFYMQLGLMSAIFTMLVYVGRLSITTVGVRSTHQRRRFNAALMVGKDPEAYALADRIKNLPQGMGIEVVGHVSADLENFETICSRMVVNRVIISPALSSGSTLPRLMSRLLPTDVLVYVSPSIYDITTSAFRRISNVRGEPLVEISRPHISPATINFKRVADVVCSLFAIILLSPVMVLLALWIKVTSKGPIIYKQTRMGLRKREFQILKFRSMIENAEAETGPTLSSDDDPRITPIGRFMRKYRLDELPQFFNILRGEMSLVGPRPERRFFADQLAAREPVYSMLYQVRPGLTSWGMVRFGYASSIDDMLQRLRYDLIYLENISLATDLKILLHTVNTVISGSGM